MENETAALNKIGKKKIGIIFALVIIIAVISFKISMPANTENDETQEESSMMQHQSLQKMTQQNVGMVGNIEKSNLGNIDPMTYLSTWNFNNLPPEERSKYYKETKRNDGSLLREYWIYTEDKEIEVAPGIMFPAWTYNGQVPGPTIRATEGDLIKIYFENRGTKPHSVHLHGYHKSEMDGSMPDEMILPGGKFTYEFDADPFGVHLFHCHSVPLSQHISKGLHGAYIVDPKKDTRPKADRELIMVMNGFDVNFDGANEIYAVNSVAFYYTKNPIKVKVGELVRIYLINMLEFDQINSFHLHANFFDEYPTGTSQKPASFTDTVVMGQGERSILDVKFKYPGMYMFHAHKTEFADLGWSGHFEVVE